MEKQTIFYTDEIGTPMFYKEPSPIFIFYFFFKLLEVWYHKKAQIFLIHNCFIHSNGLTISIENLNVHIWSDDFSNETEKKNKNKNKNKKTLNYEK